MQPLRTVHARQFSTKFDVHSFTGIPPKKQHLIPTSGTYPKGFNVGSIYAGIKPAIASQPDLVIVASDRHSNGAAVFTKNEFPAASITSSRGFLRTTKGHGLRGVVANSGCANTLTGSAGLADAIAMAREADKHLPGRRQLSQDHENSSMLVMHTGVGAKRLPIDDILENIPQLYQEGLGSSHDHWLKAATGLCTTDTFPKLASRTFILPSAPPDMTFSIAGITKRAGMVHPNMATTLGIICTDVPVTPVALQEALSAAADKSYNSISIDGDTSTNDMVAIFANGAAAPANMVPIDKGLPDSENYLAFSRVLEDFMADMAKLVVRDAEGASKFITIRVRGGPRSDTQDWHLAAKRIASVIARSSLVKTAFYGQDPEVWSGIIAALGYSLLGTRFAGQGIIIPERTSISFADQGTGLMQKFLDKGVPVHVDEATAKELMAAGDIEVVLDLRDGETSRREEAVFWTSDLTHDFVTIN